MVTSSNRGRSTSREIAPSLEVWIVRAWIFPSIEDAELPLRVRFDPRRRLVARTPEHSPDFAGATPPLPPPPHRRQSNRKGFDWRLQGQIECFRQVLLMSPHGETSLGSNTRRGRSSGFWRRSCISLYALLTRTVLALYQGTSPRTPGLVCCPEVLKILYASSNMRRVGVLTWFEPRPLKNRHISDQHVSDFLPDFSLNQP